MYAVVYGRILSICPDFEEQILKLTKDSKGLHTAFTFLSESLFYAVYQGDNELIDDFLKIQEQLYPYNILYSVAVGDLEKAFTKARLYLEAILDRCHYTCAGVIGEQLEHTAVNSCLRIAFLNMSKWKNNTYRIFTALCRSDRPVVEDIANDIGISKRAVYKLINRHELHDYATFFYTLQKDINKVMT